MVASSLVFGITLEQADTLDRLVRTISANGDVIATGAAAHLDARSLPVLGEAIYDAADALRGLLDQVGRQRLARPPPASGSASSKLSRQASGSVNGQRRRRS